MSLARGSSPWLLTAFLAAISQGCATEPQVTSRASEIRARFDLPVLGPIPYPQDNAPNPQRIELGQLLFFDPILSGERDVTCSTCHHPAFAFTDQRQFSAGVSGRGLGPTRELTTSLVSGATVTETPRNSQTILNVAYAADQTGAPSHVAPLFWDGRVIGLEGQALDPIGSRVEMRGDAFPGSEAEAAAVAVDSIIVRLRGIPGYVNRFLAAFPEEAAQLSDQTSEAIVDSSTLARALAAYQRELTTPTSAYDRFAQGDDDALTEEQLNGLEIFFTPGRCVSCHVPPTFSSFGYFVTGVPAAGVGKDVLPGDDTGREEHTLQPEDRYSFRVPSLRNVALTAPYMHSGVFETLDDVVRFYNDGARPRHSNIGDGDLESPVRQPLGLDEHAIASVVAFLGALTGFDDVKEQLLFKEPGLVPSGITNRYGLAFDKVVMARITAGSWHSCAISGVGSGVPNGTAYCWGRNDAGQLGNGSASSSGYQPNPQRVLNPSDGTGFEGEEGELVRFHLLAAGEDYTCGIADGSLYCWGAEPIGRNAARPTLIENEIGVRTISGGDRHLCALDGAGIAYCLGDNTSGQLGTGPQTSTTALNAVGAMSFAKIAAGGAHTCALDESGTAYCWGSNKYGQAGTGTLDLTVLSPTPVAGGQTFAEISAGVNHTCGLSPEGHAFCWGSNDVGQLGVETTLTTSQSPVAVVGDLVFETIAAGLQHTCAATASQAVYCWGSNEFGQLGRGLPPGGTHVQPDSVHTDLSFHELAAGRYHTCSTSSELGFCWGQGDFGQVGNGSTAANYHPKLVIGPP